MEKNSIIPKGIIPRNIIPDFRGMIPRGIMCHVTQKREGVRKDESCENHTH